MAVYFQFYGNETVIKSSFGNGNDNFMDVDGHLYISEYGMISAVCNLLITLCFLFFFARRVGRWVICAVSKENETTKYFPTEFSQVKFMLIR